MDGKKKIANYKKIKKKVHQIKIAALYQQKTD